MRPNCNIFKLQKENNDVVYFNRMSSLLIDAEAEGKKRKRGHNWSDAQLNELTEQYLANKEFLDGKFSTKVTNSMKNTKWAAIADDVSALGPERTVEQCKKKMADLKSLTKAKAARINNSARLTGGGPLTAERLTPLEEKVVAKIPQVSFKGIPGNCVILPVIPLKQYCYIVEIQLNIKLGVIL